MKVKHLMNSLLGNKKVKPTSVSNTNYEKYYLNACKFIDEEEYSKAFCSLDMYCSLSGIDRFSLKVQYPLLAILTHNFSVDFHPCDVSMARLAWFINIENDPLSEEMKNYAMIMEQKAHSTMSIWKRKLLSSGLFMLVFISTSVLFVFLLPSNWYLLPLLMSIPFLSSFLYYHPIWCLKSSRILRSHNFSEDPFLLIRENRDPKIYE